MRLPVETEPEPPVQLPTPEILLGQLQTVLGQLAVAATRVDKLQEAAELVVAEARQLGVTWAQIGDVTGGVTPQSAYQRWSKTGREKHRQYQRKPRSSD